MIGRLPLVQHEPDGRRKGDEGRRDEGEHEKGQTAVASVSGFRTAKSEERTADERQVSEGEKRIRKHGSGVDNERESERSGGRPSLRYLQVRFRRDNWLSFNCPIPSPPPFLSVCREFQETRRLVAETMTKPLYLVPVFRGPPFQ